jgi:allantoicase
MTKDFTELVDLAQERLGGSVLYATDDFFAEKENLLKASKPIFIDGKYTDRGKWMDGWESRRKRVPGHDFSIIRLGVPGIVRGVVVDTAFFKGNYPQACSIHGIALPGQPTPEELLNASWTEILPRSDLEGDSENRFAIESPYRFTHLRFHIYPDGGVARLRVHGEVVPDRRWIRSEVDLASVENGGQVVECNDMFFGSRHNLVFPGRSVNMGDGWETKRSRREGPDWAILKLAAEGQISRVEIDTNHFKGNHPESAALLVGDGKEWTEILARTKLQPHARHFYEDEIQPHAPSTHVLFRIWPDGGVSRLRLWGTVSKRGRELAGLARLAATMDRESEFRAVCGSTKFAQAMAAKKHDSLEQMKQSANEIWRGLSREDYLEAFRAHPKIGEKKAGARWSAKEQSGMNEAEGATRQKLAELNATYESKFGFIFIICATGKSAAEMLSSLESRLNNDLETEIENAAEEQRKITDLRLEKLVTG